MYPSIVKISLCNYCVDFLFYSLLCSVCLSPASSFTLLTKRWALMCMNLMTNWLLIHSLKSYNYDTNDALKRIWPLFK